MDRPGVESPSVADAGVSYAWPDLITQLISGCDLTQEETAWAMDQVMSGEVSPITLAGFLTALATKGETVAELAGLAQAMLAHANTPDLPSDCVDIVGTGGDRLGTVNISTMASVVIAAAGVPVVKHGNRAASSASGSADVLGALGINLDLDMAGVQEVFSEVGLTFLFANKVHPSMRFAAPARSELKVATAFNMLGPLTNPARPRAGAIGVSREAFAPLVAGVLAQNGVRALVFRGENGLDELSSTCVNQVWDVADGEVALREFDAIKELGIAPATIDQLRGGDAAANAQITERVLSGESGPIADTVALNAAAAMTAYAASRGESTGGSLGEQIAPHFEVAQQVLADGRAANLLARWREVSQALAG